jgi:hypothetical protein
MQSKVFISWSSEDQRVKRIAETFQNWFQTVFGNRIKFFYSEDIGPGENFMKKIEKELKDTQFAFFFLSRRTSKSPWVVFEAGCLKHLLDKENVYFLLTDISSKEFGELCPPLSFYQASPINTPDAVKRIVETICRKVLNSPSDTLQIQSVAERRYKELENSLLEISKNVQLLPDRYTGLLPYGDNIDCSGNFKMPRIFDEFKKELFLVGINLGFLLNLRSDQTNFVHMLRVLMQDPQKKVDICICDIWEPRLQYAWSKIVFEYFDVALRGFTEVFQNKESPLYLDTFIRKITGDQYDQITTQLTIKKIEMLGDTFWFVDADETQGSGVMMLIPMTAQTGHDRSVFFANQKSHDRLFNGYYSLCRAGFNAYAKVMWPVFA